MTHPVVFQHETRDILLCVHVVDLLCTGVRDDLVWPEKPVWKKYELETLLMGGDDDPVKKAVYLGRTHWNGARTVLAYGQIEERRIVEVSPRHRVPPWRRKEIEVIKGGKSKKFEGNCFWCGACGHMMEDCQKKAAGKPQVPRSPRGPDPKPKGKGKGGNGGKGKKPWRVEMPSFGECVDHRKHSTQVGVEVVERCVRGRSSKNN